MTGSISKSRLRHSIAIVIAMFLVVLMVDVLFSMETSRADAQIPRVGISASEIIGQPGDIEGLLDRAEWTSSSADSAVPEWFEREIGLPSQCRDVRVDETGAVVGCITNAKPDEALLAIRLQMEKRGWSEVPLGNIEGSTFVKKTGSCSWALVTCTQIGASTSIVYRCVHQ